MPICINQKGDIFEEIIDLPEDRIDQLTLNHPITHALVVARNRDGFLLLFNHWKQNWELPGGVREAGESLRACALREMLEETNQIPRRIDFRGLMKFKLKNGKTEYGGLFSADIDNERPFLDNEEAEKMIYWDLHTDIGYIDEIDKELLKYY
ncbi:NUDIX domain-containing protein [Paenibacillus gallinarum]|uniref:NUDIX hydrolase n=1 Tax=Paenibacillus gallinarum TaxID=2762232 RepID=A0ABR8T0J1_9BACL|nr:NUDIX hydrolase [Paenibacillus gallinarum]MBD7969207.1 NUDIX hydrolase [Paenibacillus gallinarum]